jgi:glutaredoxin
MFLDWLSAWWRRARAGPEVVMYTRRGCHLCEEAWQQLCRARRRYGFPLREVDVDDDAELRQRYGMEVPVVTVGGKVRFRGRVNPVLLERLFQASRGRQPPEGGSPSAG